MATQNKPAMADIPTGLETGTVVRRLQIGCWIGLIAIAVVRAWFTRYELTPDSMSYLDIARAVAEGHPHAAINTYWSPGYPVLISLFLRLFRPNAYWEFPLVHAVNLLIFAGTLASFQMFWREALQCHRIYAKGQEAKIPEDAFWALGYAVFGIAILNIITVGLVGPDLMVSAFACLAGWSALRFRRAPGIGPALLLGLVLALGYYSKAPFFPMGVVFILCACWQRPVVPRTVLLAGTAAAAFLLISFPLVNALSRENGRLTFGDSARISQAFYVNGVQYFRHWQGGPPGSGIPVHPTRKLNDFPRIYEFAAENMGTYPPWYAPTYWYAGIRPHLDLRRQAALFIRNLAVEFQIIMELGAALVFVVILLPMLAGYRKPWIQGLSQLWFVWVPGAVALLMFASIHVERRFLGGWLVMLFAGVVCACVLPPDAGTSRAVRCIGIAALFTVWAAVIIQASREAVGIDHAEGRSSEDATIATGLFQNGFHAGDHIAVIGDGTAAYWAHLARLQIIAEIPGSSASRPGLPAMD
ncbi:MAG TPA: hypothetical protein VH164_10010, partial [Ktedonobacteraceae bacterium]|nr:hypothetical protein [Ktedonobacteraceae bacterium]